MTTNAPGRLIGLERAGWFGIGALAMLIAGYAHGNIKFEGDFMANVAGAAIGGAISVGLAVRMFKHERDVAKYDADEANDRNWAAAIREALRYIRAIRETIVAGRAITKNTSNDVTAAIEQAGHLTIRALMDVNLTDFPLRLRMEKAAEHAFQVAKDLRSQIAVASLPNADVPLMAAANTCDPAIEAIDKLIAEYTAIRNAPSL